MFSRSTPAQPARANAQPSQLPRKPAAPAPAASSPASAGARETPTLVKATSAPRADLDPRLLSSYGFIDLYLHESPVRPCMVRGLRPVGASFMQTDKNMAPVPQVLGQDVRLFHVRICKEWEALGRRRSFPFKYRGEIYRCTLLAPPGDGAPGKARPQMDWVVRHVQSRPPRFEDLNSPSWLRQAMGDLTHQRGLVLVGGSFASGKTTLASCAFNYWVSEAQDVGIALEDPPEIPLEKVTHDEGIIYQFDLTDLSVKEAIKNARRMSPRYLFLGEIRGGDVALELLSMAISGPLVVCTIHASDLVNAISSLFRFASDAMSEEAARDMIASCLKHVFHQEINKQVVRTKMARIEGEDASLIKATIRDGQFRALNELFARQEITSRNRMGM